MSQATPDAEPPLRILVSNGQGDNTFRPGDAIVGRVRYKLPRGCAQPHEYIKTYVTLSLFGQLDVEIMDQNREDSMTSQIDLIADDSSPVQMLEEPSADMTPDGIFTLEWAFAIVVPSKTSPGAGVVAAVHPKSVATFVDQRLGNGPLLDTFKFSVWSHGAHCKGCTTYGIYAKLLTRYSNREVAHAMSHLRIRQTATPSSFRTAPIMSTSMYNLQVSARSLVPATRAVEQPLMGKIKQALGISVGPTLAFRLVVQMPASLPLNYAGVIPVELRAEPVWAKTDEALRDVMQTVKLTMAEVSLCCSTNVRAAHGRRAVGTQTVQLTGTGIAPVPSRLDPAPGVPFGFDGNASLDVGQLLGCRLPEPVHWSQTDNPLSPDFWTHTLIHSHTAHYAFDLEVAGQHVSVRGSNLVSVTPPVASVVPIVLART